MRYLPIAAQLKPGHTIAPPKAARPVIVAFHSSTLRPTGRDACKEACTLKCWPGFGPGE